MKVLLDENLPHALRRELAGHDVSTVKYLGWNGLKNGALLARAAASGFKAIITMDNGVPYQQNAVTLPLAIVVLHAPSNRVQHLRPLVPALLQALDALKPKTVIHVG